MDDYDARSRFLSVIFPSCKIRASIIYIMAKKYAKKFYKSNEWQRARMTALIRDKGMCQTPGCYRPAEEVHHIIHLTPENINDADISLNVDNLISLCRDCHMRQHDKDRVQAFRHNDILPDITFDGGRPSPLVKK